MPLFSEKSVSTISEFTDALHEVLPPSEPRWFRGQADKDWKLMPSLARAPAHVDSELALVKRFKQNAFSLLNQLPQNEWAWLFLMQHHGAPTRLLDWSENPLVALYFAVSDAQWKDKDAAVWCLDPIALNKAGWMQSPDKGDLPFFGIDTELEAYSTEKLTRPGASKPPIAALAPRYFPRLVAQAGVFTVTHRKQIPVEEAHEGLHVGKIVIPSSAKKRIEEDLAVLGITRLSLYPELDAVAEFAMKVIA